MIYIDEDVNLEVNGLNWRYDWFLMLVIVKKCSGVEP